MPIELGNFLAMLGLVIALAGWLSGRDKKLVNEGEWKGEINTKLDTLIKDSGQIPALLSLISDHETRISVLEMKGDFK